jgi:hypothetical protein
MIKYNADSFPTSPEHLARVIAVDENLPETWTPADLREMLLHQLKTPLQADLQLEAQAGNVASFADLLHGQAPPVILLQQAADFAKAQYEAPQEVLPRDSPYSSITRASPLPRNMRMCGSVP